MERCFLKATKIVMIILSTVICVSCRTASDHDYSAVSSAENPVSPSWQAHLDSFKEQPMQERCLPKTFRSKKSPSKGSIVLIHGFTACTQQFFDLSEKLSDRGFSVYLPVLPGHGRVVSYDENSPASKNYSAIPHVSQGKEAYLKYIRFIVALSKELPKPVFIGGLSVGGAISAAAISDPSHEFKRALVMTPYFSLAKGGTTLAALEKVKAADFLGVLQKLNVFDGVYDRETGWGEVCEKHETAAGRAGYCRFQVGHIALVEQLGKSWGRSKVKGNVELLLIGVQEDKAVSNESILAYARGNKINELPARYGCFYREGANHSLLSKYDNPSEDKFWKASIESNIMSFFETGKNPKVKEHWDWTLPICL